MNDDDHAAAFAEAVKAHQLALALYGEDDPRSVDALLVVMCLAPDELFAEMEELAHATRH